MTSTLLKNPQAAPQPKEPPAQWKRISDSFIHTSHQCSFTACLLYVEGCVELFYSLFNPIITITWGSQRYKELSGIQKMVLFHGPHPVLVPLNMLFPLCVSAALTLLGYLLGAVQSITGPLWKTLFKFQDHQKLTCFFRCTASKHRMVLMWGPLKTR